MADSRFSTEVGTKSQFGQVDLSGRRMANSLDRLYYFYSCQQKTRPHSFSNLPPQPRTPDPKTRTALTLHQIKRPSSLTSLHPQHTPHTLPPSPPQPSRLTHIANVRLRPRPQPSNHHHHFLRGSFALGGLEIESGGLRAGGGGGGGSLFGQGRGMGG